MRVLSLAEFELTCDTCNASLAATSEDVEQYGGVRYVKCPVCGNTILINNTLYKRVDYEKL